ncbi:MAG TPA: pitrilysin family protein [Methylomirabilota bacterium]|jgi:zinc protease|nr:pitrilysin family protein [Methylomirabilota bacterium]
MPRLAPRRVVWVALGLLPWLALPAAGQSPGSVWDRPLGVRFVLPNGVVVLVAERPALPIVIVRVAVGAGAILDPPDKPGLANLTVQLISRGTRTRTGPEIDRAIEFVGGSLSAEGGRDVGTLSVSVLRHDFGLGLDLLTDVLRRPTFPADEFDRKREEIRAAVRRSEEDPESVAGRLFRALIFPGHPYAAPIPGTEESLGRITRDDVAAFYAAAYRPRTTVVAVVGDVTIAEVRAALTARLGGWPAAPAGRTPPGLVALGTPARTEMVQRDLTQATVLLGQATVTWPHPDYYPLVVAAHLLGGGSSSRLYVRVREERGLAYSVYADYSPTRYGGMMLVGFQSENPRLREVLALVRAELVRLRQERVSDEEVARARAYLVGSFPLRMDTNAEVAALLIGIEQFGLGLDYPARYRRAIEAVTADDVLRAVRAQWDPDLMSLAVVANLRAAGLASP